MKKAFIHIINWYALNLPFPPKGFSVFYRFCKWAGIHETYFRKKIRGDIVLQLNINDHIQRQLFWHGGYEQEEINILAGLLTPDDTFIDIGANVGIYSLSLSGRVGQNGKVIAFEPSPVSYPHLLKHIELNSLQNITAIQKAVSDKNGQATLFVSGNHNRGSSGLQPGDEYSGQTAETELVKLDEWIITNSIGRVTAIKIDIEGHEMQALRGMRQTIQQFRPAFLMEIMNTHLQKHNHHARDIYSFMFQYGYNAFVLNKKNKLERVTDTDTENYSVFFLTENAERNIQ